jgi:hypothetical protein
MFFNDLYIVVVSEYAKHFLKSNCIFTANINNNI